jgi:riboflavin kinase
MKPYLLQMLKELALLGGLNNQVELSSLQLAEKLNISQQSSSRYILELEKKGYIKREMGIKKQLIQITENGQENLKDEYLEYKHIFELSKRIYFSGKIISGMGEGTYYTSQDGYIKQFKEKLGFIPYPGTLNVEIESIEKNKLRLLKKFESIDINSFESNNRTFGNVKCFHASINNKKCVLVLPGRGHYSKVLEIISKEYLRNTLKLNDDDKVEVVVEIEK